MSSENSPMKEDGSPSSNYSQVIRSNALMSSRYLTFPFKLISLPNLLYWALKFKCSNNNLSKTECAVRSRWL
jgi:hypothetical protein